MKSSSASVLALLRAMPEGITPKDAMQIGCMRLAARIADLKADGWPIESRMVPVRSGPRLVYVAKYRLIQAPEQLRLAV